MSYRDTGRWPKVQCSWCKKWFRHYVLLFDHVCTKEPK